MPYIDPKQRQFIDENIDALAGVVETMLGGTDDVSAVAGVLNYIVCRLAFRFLLGGKPSYSRRSAIHGVILDAADEWYRRIMAPYEDRKIAENGDVFVWPEDASHKDVRNAENYGRQASKTRRKTRRA